MSSSGVQLPLLTVANHCALVCENLAWALSPHYQCIKCVPLSIEDADCDGEVSRVNCAHRVEGASWLHCEPGEDLAFGGRLAIFHHWAQYPTPPT